MDRVFDKDKIEELLKDDKKILDQFCDKLKEIQGILGKAQAKCCLSSISTVSDAEFASAIKSLSKIAMSDFKDTKSKIDKALEAVNTIVKVDSEYSKQIEELKKIQVSIQNEIDNMIQFIDTTPLTVKSEDFSRLLVEKVDKFNMTSQELDGIINNIASYQKGINKEQSKYSKDPVNLSTGNFIYDSIDIRYGEKDDDSFYFKRFYNSVNSYVGFLGKDWNSNYEIKVVCYGENFVKVFLEDGQEQLFSKVDDFQYAIIFGQHATLRKTEEGFRYEKLCGDEYLFDNEGKLIRWNGVNGDSFVLSYIKKNDVIFLKKVTKKTGEFFRFKYNENGLLESVCDECERTVHYEYKDNLLIKVIKADGSEIVYNYSANGKLESVQNADNIIAVENEFDANGRTVRQYFPDGSKMEYIYNDENHSITMIERNGSKSINYHDDRLRNTKIVYSDGTEEFTFNNMNLKTSFKDKNGNITKYSYDYKGNMTGIIRPSGLSCKIEFEEHNKPTAFYVNGKKRKYTKYDSFGKILEFGDVLNRSVKFEYSNGDNPSKIIMPDGAEYSIEYDDRNHIKRIIDAYGNFSAYEYNRLNQVVKTKDFNDNVSTYEYDIVGNLVKQTNAQGFSKLFEYNKSGLVTKIVDYDGSTVMKTYNNLNKLDGVTDQLGRKTSFKYDTMWNVSKIILPNGAETTFIYNENDLLTRRKDALGNSIRYKYDAVGNIVSIEDEEGAITKYEYDEDNRLIKVIEPNDAVTTYEYDEDGNVSKVVNPLGDYVVRQYDLTRKLIKEEDNKGHFRKYEYDLMGNIYRITDEIGRTESYEYLKGTNHITKHIDFNGTCTEYLYDPNGNVIESIDEFGCSTKYEYDSLNRLIKEKIYDGTTIEYKYDAMNNLIEAVNQKGAVTKYEYSLTGEVTKVVDAEGNETSYVYDECDRLIEIYQKDINTGKVISKKYERDLLGNIKTAIDGLGQKEKFSFNKRGELTERIDKEGFATKFVYNLSGDVKKVQYADGKEVECSYDVLRRLIEIKDWLGITKFEKNSEGQITKVTYPSGENVEYEYDALGNRKNLKYPNGKEVQYKYNKDSLLTELVSGENIVNYVYNNNGQILEKKVNCGLSSRYEYNEKGMLSKITNSDSKGIVDEFVYKYDEVLNLVGINKKRRNMDSENGLYTYSYDKLSRLVDVHKDGKALRKYTYDAFGNRLSFMNFEKKTSNYYEYNDNNQLKHKITTEDGIDLEHEYNYSYDKRGNLSQIVEDNVIKHQYLYGSLNRLERVIDQSGNRSDYVYNGLGHRVGKKSVINGKSISSNWIIDLTREYNNLLQKTENNMMQQYLWDENLVTVENIEFDETKSLDRYLCLNDPMGTPMRLFDTNYDNVETYSFDEFGNNTYNNNSSLQPFGFTGYQYDRLAETYYAQAREYRANDGIFAGEDNIKGTAIMPMTMNTYVYTVQNPLSSTDKTGYWCGWDDLAAMGAGAISGVGYTFVGDMIHSVQHGKLELSSWQDYTGAAVGGAIGAEVTLYAGPVAGNAANCGVTTFASNELKVATNAKDKKDQATILKETARDSLWGAFTAGVGDKIKVSKISKGTEKLEKKLAEKVGFSGSKVEKMLQKGMEQDEANGIFREWTKKDISLLKGLVSKEARKANKEELKIIVELAKSEYKGNAKNYFLYMLKSGLKDNVSVRSIAYRLIQENSYNKLLANECIVK